jgi:hypothetical protein
LAESRGNITLNIRIREDAPALALYLERERDGKSSHLIRERGGINHYDTGSAVRKALLVAGLVCFL